MVFGAVALLQALEVLAVGLAADIARLKSLVASYVARCGHVAKLTCLA